MLFAVDVGNTNITVGLFDGKKLIKTFRITTGTARTSDCLLYTSDAADD